VGRTNNNWLNPAAFAMPAPGTWGNLGRYAARDPGFFELDLALQKKFLLTERIGLNFRAEMFNIFNEAIYATPPPVLTPTRFRRRRVSAEFTLLLNTGAMGTDTPREFQFAVRLSL
jgi:hypothetical protein